MMKNDFIKYKMTWYALSNPRTGLGKYRKYMKILFHLVNQFAKYSKQSRLALLNAFENEIPDLSEDLSRVFAALTRHTWYDRLTIAKDILPKLELRVTSSQDPTNSHPTAVLNGQAESALDLVPYFTFSQADDTPTEVYLVLLDDPTRAFDEGHIEILVERLAELGRNVQLMVASQETTRFRKLVPEKFDPDSYVIVKPTSWSYYDGPELDIEYA